MKPIHLSFGAALAIWAAILLPAAGHAQPVVHGLTTGNSLVRFSATGGAVVPGPALSGLGAGEAAVGIDFRPLTSELYLLTRDAANLGRLYTVDPGTGQATAVPLSGAALTLSGSVDIDFNPAALSGANALRIVTGGGQNYRLVFGAGGATVNVDGALNLPGGGTPNVIATAYSNNRAGLPGGGGAGGTRQYALEATTGTLYRVNPPNDGTLTEPKPLGVAFGATGGLDIVTGTDRALAVLEVAGARGLYEISLDTGAVTLLRALPADIVDLTVPMPAAFPSTLVYGLGPDNSLLSFNTDQEMVAMGPALSGLGEGETAAGIDFRPLTGALYLVTRDAANLGRLYTVDPGTGQATAVPLSGAALMLSGSVDIDFNPAALSGVNALRIVTSAGQNYRLVFGAGGATVNVDGALNLPGGGTPGVIATAYSNNRAGLPGGGGSGGTRQYAIDAATGTLYRVNPPNDGTLTEPKPLGLNIAMIGGLDITTTGDRALAVLEVAGARGLYEIDFNTGAPRWIRELPATVLDLAVPVPVTLGAVELAGAGASGRTLTWSGGVGPYAVQRADVVTDPFCAVAAVTTRTVTVGTDGPAGFFQIADLAATPSVRLTVSLSGAAERPEPVTTSGGGFGTLEIKGNTLFFDLGYEGLSGAAVAAHIHGPADSEGTAGVLIDLGPFNDGAFGTAGTLRGSVGLTMEQKAALLGARAYVNIHTGNHPGGEVRGQIAPAVFQTVLSGAAERPAPATTTATGFGQFALVGNELAFEIFYRGLSGPAVAAHFHGPAGGAGTAGVLVDLAPFNQGGFGVSGSLAGRLTLTPAQVAAFADGKVYVNLHTAAFPGGELRGQVLGAIVGRPFGAALTGAAERPTPVSTTAAGYASLTLEGDRLSLLIGYRGLSGTLAAAHIHGPATAAGTAGVQFDLAPFHRGAFGVDGVFSGAVTLLPEQKAALLRGELYLNLHTAAHPGGELRGQVVPVILPTTLTGAAERPNPVATAGEGRGYFGLTGRHVALGLRYRGLSGAAQAAHLHGPATAEGTAGVLIDLAPFAGGGFGSAGFLRGGVTLTDSQLAAAVDGLTYVNIHTAMHPGGEIRGHVTR
jgi:hypothetical protein